MSGVIMPAMGHQSRARKKKHEGRDKIAAKIIHTDKLFGGRETAMDVHRAHAWTGGRCNGCGSGDIIIQVSTHMPTRELITRHPQIAGRIMAASGDGQVPSWQSKYGPMTRVGVAYSCSQCQPALERAAARGPSYVLVEIDRGPGQDKVTVQVPRMIVPAPTA